MTSVRIPPTLRVQTGGEREVSADGDTVRELLDDLMSRFPSLRGQLLNGDDELAQFVNVYVDGEDVRTLDGLETPVRDGATVILLPAMAGGSLTSPAAAGASCSHSGTGPAEPESAEA
jgi:molybdopterin synthase sulfur carrier subunit